MDEEIIQEDTTDVLENSENTLDDSSGIADSVEIANQIIEQLKIQATEESSEVSENESITQVDYSQQLDNIYSSINLFNDNFSSYVDQDFKVYAMNTVTAHLFIGGAIGICVGCLIGSVFYGVFRNK